MGKNGSINYGIIMH